MLARFFKGWRFWIASLLLIGLSPVAEARSYEENTSSKGGLVAHVAESSEERAKVYLTQTNELAAIVDFRVESTPGGLEIVFVSKQPLTIGDSRVSGNAFILEIPDATLVLDDPTVAEQFGPADGIALVQLANLSDGRVQLSVTGTQAPPDIQVSQSDDNLVLSVVPGMATADTEDPDAIQLVVTATRTEENVLDIPRSVTIIDREQLEQQQQLTDNLPDILGRLVPGLGPPTLQNSTRNLSLRGRPALILIDGVPQNP
ncbi:MAG: TonB-dependent receptor plug domain-containing protein, partial [Cyanobacteria bacterium J06626_6]